MVADALAVTLGTREGKGTCKVESEVERLTQLCGERQIIGLGTCVLKDVGRMVGVVVRQHMTHITMTEVYGGRAVPVDIGIGYDNGVEVAVIDALKGKVDATR